MFVRRFSNVARAFNEFATGNLRSAFKQVSSDSTIQGQRLKGLILLDGEIDQPQKSIIDDLGRPSGGANNATEVIK